MSGLLTDEDVEKYKKLVYFIVSKFSKGTVAKEDMISAGFEGLCKAKKNYKDGGVAFITYAYNCIRYEILNEINKADKSKAISIDDENTELIDNISVTNSFINDYENKELINYLFKRLSLKEKTVLKLRFIDELTLREIGNKMGITCERVRQIEKNAIEKMRQCSQDVFS